MNLFDHTPVAILPYEGVVSYHEHIIGFNDANDYFKKLSATIDWKHDEVKIFGHLHITKRMVAWYADGEYDYTYSNTTKKALPFTPELIALKKLAEQNSEATYNSCLLNLYHSGDEGMGWHSDNEKSIVSGSAIASFSFGAERRFLFKHKVTKETVSITLGNGSLLVMKDEVQEKWLHSLPKSKKIVSPRINLTFRMMNELH